MEEADEDQLLMTTALGDSASLRLHTKLLDKVLFGNIHHVVEYKKQTRKTKAFVQLRELIVQYDIVVAAESDDDDVDDDGCHTSHSINQSINPTRVAAVSLWVDRSNRCHKNKK